MEKVRCPDIEKYEGRRQKLEYFHLIRPKDEVKAPENPVYASQSNCGPTRKGPEEKALFAGSKTLCQP